MFALFPPTPTYSHLLPHPPFFSSIRLHPSELFIRDTTFIVYHEKKYDCYSFLPISFISDSKKQIFKSEKVLELIFILKIKFKTNWELF